MAQQLAREQGITLRGSAEIVAEFFCKCRARPRRQRELAGPGRAKGRALGRNHRFVAGAGNAAPPSAGLGLLEPNGAALGHHLTRSLKAGVCVDIL